jgi:hypothetical protein
MTAKIDRQRRGLVAILDALGASTYTGAQVRRFIRARDDLLAILRERDENGSIEGKGKIEGSDLSVFTFGDTLLISYSTGKQITRQGLVRFFALIRRIVAQSLYHKVLFRGSIGYGDFYLDRASNTVLGDAVLDAASWYTRADWIGVVATPRTTLMIEGLLGSTVQTKRWALLRYPVPLKGGQEQALYCVNWPKIFRTPHLSPAGKADPRRTVLRSLAKQIVPLGTESKYANTVTFFDHSTKVGG